MGGQTEGVEWKVGVAVGDGALMPIFEFSRVVPREHPAILEAYLALARCVQSVLGEAWSAKAMCPICHLPTASPVECECCDQRMCQVCRARHDRGRGIPGTGEPGSHERGARGGSEPSTSPRDLQGYG